MNRQDQAPTQPAAPPQRPVSSRARRCGAGLLLALAALVGNTLAAECTVVANGDWNVPATWSGCAGGVPGAGDTARFNTGHTVTIPDGVAVTVAAIMSGPAGSGTLTVDGSLTVGDVVQNFITIGGAGPITVTGTWDWLGNGILEGTLAADGSGAPLTFAPGAVWNLSGNSMRLRRRALVTHGNANYSAGGIGCSSSVTWRIASGAILAISHAGTITSGGGDCRIRNEGTIRKTGAGTTFQITDTRVLLENHGLIEVQAGEFDFFHAGGPTQHTGIFRTAAGARLRAPRSPAEYAASVRFEGTGTVAFTNSNASTFLGDVAFPGPVVLDGADLIASAGTTLSFPAGLTWHAGRVRGPGTFLMPTGSTLTLTGPQPKAIGASAQVHLEGTTLWQDGEWQIQPSATPPHARLLNAAGADIQVLSRPVSMNFTGDDDSVFENLGNFTATSAAQTGLLRLGGSHRGTIVNRGTMTLAGQVDSPARAWRQVAGHLVLDDVRMQLVGEGFNRPMALEGGVVSGTGVLTGAVHNSGAVIMPGGVDGIGAIGIAGRYAETADAVLDLEVSGATPDLYDRLVVTGTPGRVDLRGDIEVTRLGGFQFAATDVVTLVDARTAPATSDPASVTVDPAFAPAPEVRRDLSRVVLARDVLFADDFEAPIPIPQADTVFVAGSD